MSIPIYQVDAFTNTPFRGNPAAVCLLSGPRNGAWMSAVAAEMNLSETAFLVPRDDGYDLRWFTPRVEVSLCGHATLASAHVLWETGRLPPDHAARFHTASGLLTVTRKDALIWMDLPAALPEPSDLPEGLARALGVAPVNVVHSTYGYLVEVESGDIVRAMTPDFAGLAEAGVGFVIVTGAASENDRPRYDFVSRFFAPGIGIPEDPVTGAAHCTLGPYWAERLGQDELSAYQASERGGEMQVRVAEERVHLGGKAITVLQGELVEEEGA